MVLPLSLKLFFIKKKIYVLTRLIRANLISVMLEEPAALLEENTTLKGQVRELEGENANLRLKVRALELAQARAGKPDDDRQCHLDISHTESVRVESDDAGTDPEAEAAPEPTIPSSTTKRGRKLRVGPEAKFENLPVSEEVILIPEEVKADPQAWIEIPGEITYEVLVHPTRLSRRKIDRTQTHSFQLSFLFVATALPPFSLFTVELSNHFVDSALAFHTHKASTLSVFESPHKTNVYLAMSLRCLLTTFNCACVRPASTRASFYHPHSECRPAKRSNQHRLPTFVLPSFFFFFEARFF